MPSPAGELFLYYAKAEDEGALALFILIRNTTFNLSLDCYPERWSYSNPVLSDEYSGCFYS